MKTLLERDYVKLIYSPEKKHLTQRWLGFANIKQFKEAIDATVTISEKNDVKKILSDTRQQAIVKKEATDYAASVMPLLIKNGLKKMAFLLPESIFTKWSLENFTSETKIDIIKHFGNEREAEEWLFNE